MFRHCGATEIVVRKPKCDALSYHPKTAEVLGWNWTDGAPLHSLSSPSMAAPLSLRLAGRTRTQPTYPPNPLASVRSGRDGV